MNLLDIIIEEWAGENKLFLSKQQINELVAAISVGLESELVNSVSCNNIEMNKLKKQIYMLERFILEKGFCISYSSNCIIEQKIEAITNDFQVSREVNHYF